MKTIPAVNRYFDRLVELKSHKRVTAAANELLNLSRTASFQHWAVDAYYAPSECHGDVDSHMLMMADEIAKKHGFLNAEILLKVIEKRTSHRWVYFSNISYAVR